MRPDELRGKCIACIFLLLTCCQRAPSPVKRRVSVEALATITYRMTATEVRKRIGRPSFEWSAGEFSKQGYPFDQKCVRNRPTTMWVYYDDRGTSACVYFDSHDHVLLA